MEDNKPSSTLANPNEFVLEMLSDVDMEEWVTVSKESTHDPTDDNIYRPHQVDTLALQNQQGPRSNQAIQSTPSISLERRFGSSDEDPLHQGHQVMHRREYFLLFTRVLVKRKTRSYIPEPRKSSENASSATSGRKMGLKVWPKPSHIVSKN